SILLIPFFMELFLTIVTGKLLPCFPTQVATEQFFTEKLWTCSIFLCGKVIFPNGCLFGAAIFSPFLILFSMLPILPSVLVLFCFLFSTKEHFRIRKIKLKRKLNKFFYAVGANKLKG